GHCRASADPRCPCVPEGTFKSRISNVIAMAKTPSENASTRAVSFDMHLEPVVRLTLLRIYATWLLLQSPPLSTPPALCSNFPGIHSPDRSQPRCPHPPADTPSCPVSAWFVWRCRSPGSQ